VLVANSGEEALPIIKEQNPEIMLLDMNLPKMSGIELLKLVRQFNNIVKVIMVSGYELNSNDPQFQELDIFEFMRKPIGFSELESIIKKAVV
jgi:YesN/AraC family two-component response regulator